MRLAGKSSLLALILALVSIQPDPAGAVQLFRWTDDTGHIYYSDQVPPRHSKYQRAKLNEQGMTVNVLERAKSKAEMEREQKLGELRAAQQRLLEEQRSRDRLLLRTFSSEKEITEHFESRSRTLEMLDTVIRGNLSRLQSQLDAEEKRAAEFERSGKVIPDFVVSQIHDYQKQIEENQQKLGELANQKLELENDLAANLERFKALTEGKQELLGASPQSHSVSSANQEGESLILSVAPCSDEAICEKAWNLARSYLLQHSNTAVQIDTDLIINTFTPENDEEIALSLAKIRDQDSPGAQLFLDARCKPSSIGQEICSGERVRGILSAFPLYIASGLKSARE
ncbi:MAG: DUF4124 domain-containing protein [Gammaproteobacteria bacterium]